MLMVFKDNPLAGTVGSRLYYGDNTIQHSGMVILKNQKTNKIDITHLELNSYHPSFTNDYDVLGNTGGFMMIRKNVFIKCGMFNEKYVTCFEDVELNIKCIINGLKNILSGKASAYDYESQTRTKSNDTLKNTTNDYNSTLLPFIKDNINKIKKYVVGYDR